MRRWLAILLAWGFSGCDNTDAGLVFEKYVRPDDECLNDPAAESAIFYRFDPFFQGDLDVFAVLRNDLIAEEQVFNSQLGLGVTPDARVTVTEFEHVFECDSSVFSGAGQLFLPGLGASGVPFCQNPRDRGGAFQGFDVRPTDGASIEPGQTQPVGLKLITGELGRRFQDMFALAVAADTCCRASVDDLCGQGRIDELPTGAGNEDCDQLRTAVVSNRLPVSEIPTLRQFAKFDVTYLDGQGWIGSPYTLRVLGNYVGVTTGGRTVTSNQAQLTLQMAARELEQQYLTGGLGVAQSLREQVACQSRVILP